MFYIKLYKPISIMRLVAGFSQNDVSCGCPNGKYNRVCQCKYVSLEVIKKPLKFVFYKGEMWF